MICAPPSYWDLLVLRTDIVWKCTFGMLVGCLAWSQGVALPVVGQGAYTNVTAAAPAIDPRTILPDVSILQKRIL